MTSAQKDLETANSTIIELTSKYQDEFGVFQCKDKNIEPVLSNHEDMTCTCTKNLEKLIVDSMEENLEIEIAKDNYRYKCEGDIGKEEFSKIPAAKVTTDEKYDTTEHFHNRDYSSAMKVVTPCVPSLVSHWIPLSKLCSDDNLSFDNISAIPSLRSHYVRLPNPGEAITSLSHLDQEFRELLRVHRRGQDCRQS